MHENHASIVALHRLKTFFKKSADTFASTQYLTDERVTYFFQKNFVENSQDPYGKPKIKQTSSHCHAKCPDRFFILILRFFLNSER